MNLQNKSNQLSKLKSTKTIYKYSKRLASTSHSKAFNLEKKNTYNISKKL